MDHPPDTPGTPLPAAPGAADPAPGRVTTLLAAVEAGTPGAIDELFPLIYAELRQAASRALAGERPGHTLQPTALVHEAYLKLAGGQLSAANRKHFIRLAGRAMRQILVDHARRRRAAKRGADPARVSLAEDLVGDPTRTDPEELIALDEALARLGEEHNRLRTVVEMRFFAGLGEREIAEALGVTTRTVQRDWARARARLYRLMEECTPPGDD